MANWTKEQNDIALQLAMGGSSDDEILRAVASFAPATTPNVPTPPENPQSKENNYGTFNTGSMSDAFKQGGILGVAATAPFTKQAFQALEKAETYAFTPFARYIALGPSWLANKVDKDSSLAKIYQDFESGMGTRRSDLEDASIWSKFNPVRAFPDVYSTLKDGGFLGLGEGEQTTGLNVSLPMEVNIPDWLAGPDKTLKDIDLGALAFQLPGEIAAGKGVSRVTRPLMNRAKGLNADGTIQTQSLNELNRVRELQGQGMKPNEINEVIRKERNSITSDGVLAPPTDITSQLLQDITPIQLTNESLTSRALSQKWDTTAEATLIRSLEMARRKELQGHIESNPLIHPYTLEEITNVKDYLNSQPLGPSITAIQKEALGVDYLRGPTLAQTQGGWHIGSSTQMSARFVEELKDVFKGFSIEDTKFYDQNRALRPLGPGVTRRKRVSSIDDINKELGNYQKVIDDYNDAVNKFEVQKTRYENNLRDQRTGLQAQQSIFRQRVLESEGPKTIGGSGLGKIRVIPNDKFDLLKDKPSDAFQIVVEGMVPGGIRSVGRAFIGTAAGLQIKQQLKWIPGRTAPFREIKDKAQRAAIIKEVKELDDTLIRSVITQKKNRNEILRLERKLQDFADAKTRKIFTLKGREMDSSILGLQNKTILRQRYQENYGKFIDKLRTQFNKFYEVVDDTTPSGDLLAMQVTGRDFITRLREMYDRNALPKSISKADIDNIINIETLANRIDPTWKQIYETDAKDFLYKYKPIATRFERLSNQSKQQYINKYNERMQITKEQIDLEIESIKADPIAHAGGPGHQIPPPNEPRVWGGMDDAPPPPIGRSGNPGKGRIDVNANVPPDYQPPTGNVFEEGPDAIPGNKWHTPQTNNKDVPSILQKAKGYMYTAKNSMLAGFVSDTPYSSAFNIPRRALAKTFELTVGSVNKWLVNNSWASMIMAAYASKMQHISTAARADVANFVKAHVEDLREEAGSAIKIPWSKGTKLTASNLLKRVFPSDMDTGYWGKTKEIADNKKIFSHDLTEAFWAHKHFADELMDVGDKGLHFDEFAEAITKGNLGDFFRVAEFDDLGRRKYRRLTFDERQAKFDEFFNETTEFGAARTNKLLDDLGDFVDEMEVAFDPANASLLGRRFLHREVGQFGNDRPAFARSSVFKERVYGTVAEGAAKNVKYVHNIIESLTSQSRTAMKASLQRELKDVMINPEYGIALAANGIADKLGQLINHPHLGMLSKSKNPIIRQRAAATVKFIQDTAKKVDEIEGVKKAEIEDAKKKRNAGDITEAEFNKAMDDADSAAKTKYAILDEDIKGKLTDTSARALGQEKAIAIPSAMWFVNSKDTAFGLGEFQSIFKLKSGAQNAWWEPLVGKGVDPDWLIPSREIKFLEDGLKVVDDLLGAGPTELNIPGRATRTLSKIGDFWRFSSTGFDMAFSFTVGIPLLARNPQGWAQTLKYQYASLTNPNWLKSAIAKDPALEADIRSLLDLGIGVNDFEVYKLLDKDGKINADAYIDLLKNPSVEQTLFGQAKAGLARAAQPVQRSYNTGTLMTRVYWYRALRPMYTRADGQMDLVGLKSHISNVTFALNSTELGISASRRTLENFWLALSPRLTRSAVAMMSDATRGSYHIVRNLDQNSMRFALSQGKFGKSPLQVAEEAAQKLGRSISDDEIRAAAHLTKQLQSLGNLNSLLTATMLTSYTTTYALAIANGKPPEQALREAQQSIDPNQGKKFLATQIGDSWYGIGGFWRSLFTFNYKLAYGTANALQGDYRGISDFAKLDSMENPILSMARSRGAPGVNFAGTLLEGISDGSIDAQPFDVVDHQSLPLDLAATFAPFALQGVVEGESLHSAGISVLGLRTSAVTLSDQTAETARRVLNIDADSARDISESWIKHDLLYPLIERQYGLEARSSNSDWGNYYTRKSILESEFQAAVMKQWAAGASDYRMRSIYFDLLGEMNARKREARFNAGVGDFDVNPKDPIAIAIKEWNKVYESDEYLQASKTESWDIVDKKRDELFKTFTPAQQEAVMRYGGGIHKEILAMLKPESQQKYLDRFERRKKWIRENTKNANHINTLILELEEEMFESIGVNRGVTPIEPTYQSGSTGGVPGIPQNRPLINL